ncbi:MAG: energy-coupling factor ABC transporter ATP-binding protein [Spirochaetaceae bacterium]|nr:energy-coupling factor ABC transporter ATP-binding protein [Spirochaetaceae bacterium]
MSYLQVQNISYSYEGKFPALSNISFDVEKGSCLCLAGANGSGKSTLLQIIAACIKPDAGDVCICNDAPPSPKKVSVLRDESARRKIGIVFQEPDNQLFMPTVWEDVAFAIMNKGCAMSEAKAKALNALRAVEAEHLAERPPYKLSGGEKQRAALASVLITFQNNDEHGILLIDEPTAYLDPRARKNFIQLLKKLSCTKIIATHDLDMALTISDEILFLNNGTLAARSPAPGLLSDEVFLQSIGLELPLSSPAPRRFEKLLGLPLCGSCSAIPISDHEPHQPHERIQK